MRSLFEKLHVLNEMSRHPTLARLRLTVCHVAMVITNPISSIFPPGLSAAAEYAGPAGSTRVPLHRGDGRRGKTRRAGGEGNHRLPLPEHRTSGGSARLCLRDVGSSLISSHIIIVSVIRVLMCFCFFPPLVERSASQNRSGPSDR